MDSTTINRHRGREAALLTLAAAAVCALGFASALFPAVEHTTTVALLVLAAAGVAVWLVRRVARVLRWRREDREDALTAAAWRAAHRSARTEQGVA